MPIKLVIDDHCSECSEFEPEVEKNVEWMNDYEMYEKVYRCTTVIRCEHRTRCQSITRYLEQQNRKKKGEKNGI